MYVYIYIYTEQKEQYIAGDICLFFGFNGIIFQWRSARVMMVMCSGYSMGHEWINRII